MSGRGKGFIGDFGQESGGGPDAAPRHAGQDRPKRVSNHQPLNFGSDLVTLLTQGRKLLGQTRYDDGGSLRAGHDHGLFAQSPNDLIRQAFTHAGSELGQVVGESLLAG